MDIAKKIAENFVAVAKIDSISKEEAELKVFISEKLATLGMEIQEDEYGNLYKASSTGKIFFTAHLDTVEPGRNINPIVTESKIQSDGTTIVGADNKAGVAIILTLLETIPNDLLPSIEVVFTIQEEIGMLGAAHFDTTLLSSDYGISFDKSEYNFGKCMVLGCNYSDDFIIKLKGETSHAARPKPEYNPLILFLDMFAEFPPGRLSPTETFNIGGMEGFKQVNSSPAELIIKGDVRTENKENADKFYQKLEELAVKSDSKCTMEIERIPITPGYEITEDAAGYQEIISALSEAGHTPEVLQRGSTTDAAVFSQKGIPTYLLSCGVYNTHKVDEYVLIPEMVKAYEFSMCLLKKAKYN